MAGEERQKKRMDLNHCEKFCRNGLRLIGVRDGHPWSLHSVLVSLALLLSFINCTYTCLKMGNYQQEVFHHLSLNIMGTGLVAMFIYGHSEVVGMGKMADKCQEYWCPRLAEGYQSLRKTAFGSGVKRTADLFTIFTVGIWLNILRKNWQEGVLSGDKMKLPSGLRVPGGSWEPYLVVGAHMVETLFVVSAVAVDLMVMQVFVTVSLQLSVQFRTLSMALDRIPDTAAPWNVIDCVRHHQDILRTFEMLKSFYGVAFHFIYFGMVWAIALSRSIILQEHIDLVNLLALLVLEIIYLLIFCYCADELVQAIVNATITFFMVSLVLKT